MDIFNEQILSWSIGWPELLVILIIAVVIFGKRLPQVARGLGKSLTEFKKGLHETDDATDDIKQEAKKLQDDINTEPSKEDRQNKNA